MSIFSPCENSSKQIPASIYRIQYIRYNDLKVIAIEMADGEDGEYCIVGPDTEIICDGESLGRDEDERLNEIG